MTSSKKAPTRRGPASPGSPDDLKGIEPKRSNPDGTTPELPSPTPPAPGDKPPAKPAGH